MIRNLAVAIISAVSFRAADTSGSENCDRACLQGFVDSYLDALAKHDPSKLPVAPAVKFTENGKELKLGEGFWKTAGASTYRLYALDPESGNAAAQAVVEENGGLDTFFVRLKLKDKENYRSRDVGLPQGTSGVLRAGKADHRAGHLQRTAAGIPKDRPRATD